ncbi:MAG: dTDP-4-dehydrorhamnose 3,5-epimerase [Solirubrobacteraceae bacterium]|jgi:dTDP-4-dehydrorhamnose 3,5-epimerase
MRLTTTLQGPVLIKPVVHRDSRGFFLETYRRDRLAGLGIEHEFVQDNHSRSRRGVIRGMHFQPGLAKLIRCSTGTIIDALVDLRRSSGTFGQWESFELSEDNQHALYCPDGFAHGFCVLSDVADVMYKLSTFYDPVSESGFAFDDPEVGIEWPAEVELIASERDRNAPRLEEIRDSLPFD